MKAVPGPSVLAVMTMPERPRYAQHLMADRKRSIPAVCREPGGVPASTLHRHLPADGTLKAPGMRLLGAAPTGEPQRDGTAAQGA